MSKHFLGLGIDFYSMKIKGQQGQVVNLQTRNVARILVMGVTENLSE